MAQSRVARDPPLHKYITKQDVFRFGFERVMRGSEYCVDLAYRFPPELTRLSEGLDVIYVHILVFRFDRRDRPPRYLPTDIRLSYHDEGPRVTSEAKKTFRIVLLSSRH